MTVSSTSSWLLRPTSPAAEGYLLCVPYLGTGASVYHRWPEWIGSVQVCPLQLPGRENRIIEPHYTDYRSLCREVVADLKATLRAPLALFGHCGTAYLAFEMAVELERRTRSGPIHLFLSSMPPPDQAASAWILQLSDHDLASFLINMVQQRDASVDRELIELAVEVLRADVDAYRRYALGSDRHDRHRIRTPITAIGWEADELVPPGAMRAWERYGQAEAVDLAGTHWSFLQAPVSLRNVIASRLEATIRQLSPP